MENTDVLTGRRQGLGETEGSVERMGGNSFSRGLLEIRYLELLFADNMFAQIIRHKNKRCWHTRSL